MVLIESRSKTREYLETCLLNPGRFSILVLGNHGVGKKYWIEKLLPDPPRVKLMASLAEASKSFWEAQLSAAHGGMLIVEDVEHLTKENQDLLFLALETANGNFGFSEPKPYEVRIVFTSVKSLKSLRDSEKYLRHKFFHRIAQLVVGIPGFDAPSYRGDQLLADFKRTWHKYNFQNHEEYPATIETWLKGQRSRLYGGFRDLDKLCINWHNYRLHGMREEDILKRIQGDFKAYYYPQPKREDNFEIYFSSDESYPDTIANFRRKYRDWAVAEYGTLKAAADALKVSRRTMERW